jgi:large subunit ribosomal protein L9
MANTIELLLTENVDGLGIVGDVVNVRAGYARNYLLPRAYATSPSEEVMAQLAEKRKEAERMVAELRAQREKMVDKLEGLELEIVRSCNDFGMLYGSVSQRDVAAELTEKGFAVKPREVRLPQAIKRVDRFEVPVRLDADLETTITVNVKPDRELPTDDERVEMEFDNEGNLIEPGSARSQYTATGELKPEAKAAEPAAATDEAPAAEGEAPAGESSTSEPEKTEG